MDKPPISLFIPSYVVEYAVVDSSVTFFDRRTLNVGGEWLGAVPQLAICKNVETSEYHLSHCNSDWEPLCAVQTAKTIEEIKEIAEWHYQGISAKWIPTNYEEDEVLKLLEEEREQWRCSFCRRSRSDEGVTGMFCSEYATICNLCVKAFAEDFGNSEQQPE